eukprot:scaffold16428_cov108-Isochrysis_galbana.AAC.5
MSASLSTSLIRADYGGAWTRCVAIFGRADQHSAGAEGAPYRLSIEFYGYAFVGFGGVVLAVDGGVPGCGGIELGYVAIISA